MFSNNCSCFSIHTRPDSINTISNRNSNNKKNGVGGINDAAGGSSSASGDRASVSASASVSADSDIDKGTMFGTTRYCLRPLPLLEEH